MHVVTPQIRQQMQDASWIRRMFDAGLELKQRVGAENVFDFSLGNPDVPPPAAAGDALRALAERVVKPMGLGYCPNAGLPSVRATLARKIAASSRLRSRRATSSSPAAPRAGSSPSSAPCSSPATRCSAPPPTSSSTARTPATSAACSGRCRRGRPTSRSTSPRSRRRSARAPAGPRRELAEQPRGLHLRRGDAARARRGARAQERGARAAGLPRLRRAVPRARLRRRRRSRRSCRSRPFAVVVGSFSKSLSLAGERVGYLAANPAMPDVQVLVDALTMTNRTLGFVNAPVIGQQLVEALIDASRGRRRSTTAAGKAMAAALRGAGIEFALPQGRLLLLPEGPGRRRPALRGPAPRGERPRGARARLRLPGPLPAHLLRGRGGDRALRARLRAGGREGALTRERLQPSRRRATFTG